MSVPIESNVFQSLVAFFQPGKGMPFVCRQTQCIPVVMIVPSSAGICGIHLGNVSSQTGICLLIGSLNISTQFGQASIRMEGHCIALDIVQSYESTTARLPSLSSIGSGEYFSQTVIARKHIAPPPVLLLIFFNTRAYGRH